MPVCFYNDGEFDLRSITTFGLHAKPETENPIGHFGTGLKMTIALLMREGATVTIRLGQRLPSNHVTHLQTITFSVKSKDFRGQASDVIMMHVDGKRAQALPYTTDLAKNWQLWMAFRELESNARDECGTSQIRSQVDLGVMSHEVEIVVEHEEFEDIRNNIDSYFLPEDRKPIYQDHGLEILPNDAQLPYAFYRGIRAYTLPKASRYTYNILREQKLTEDRTLRSGWDIDWEVRRAVTQSEEEDLIRALLTSSNLFYEHSISFSTSLDSPSDKFIELLNAFHRDKNISLTPGASYYHRNFLDEEEYERKRHAAAQYKQELIGSLNEIRNGGLADGPRMGKHQDDIEKVIAWMRNR